jgi:hypothetical protein
MPLSVNVGLSRKASKDYQSTGTSINIVAELDQALLARPDELQRQIDGLYHQAEQALTRQSGASQPPKTNGNAVGRAATDRANHRNGSSMTASQRRAIITIAERANIDLEFVCREIIGAAFDDLSIRQASELIDHLKSQRQPASAGRH